MVVVGVVGPPHMESGRLGLLEACFIFIFFWRRVVVVGVSSWLFLLFFLLKII